MMTLSPAVLAVAAVSVSVSMAAAQATPFTETFETGTNGWFDAADGALDFSASGALDGSAFVSETLDIATIDPFFGALAFRGDADLGASGGAFVGDYLAGGIDTLSFDIRVDGPGPLGIAARIALPGNTPSIIAFLPGVVGPGAWQTVSLDLSPDSPFIQIGGVPGSTTPEAVLSDVENLQILVTSVTGGPTSGFTTVSIDNIAITPAPGAVALLGLGGLAASLRRR